MTDLSAVDRAHAAKQLPLIDALCTLAAAHPECPTIREAIELVAIHHRSRAHKGGADRPEDSGAQANVTLARALGLPATARERAAIWKRIDDDALVAAVDAACREGLKLVDPCNYPEGSAFTEAGRVLHKAPRTVWDRYREILKLKARQHEHDTHK